MNRNFHPLLGSPWRIALALPILVLIGGAVWQSIPARRAHLSEAELATYREFAVQPKAVSPPSALSSGYVVGERGIQVVEGGLLRYDVPHLDGFFRGIFQTEGTLDGKIQIKSEGRGGSAVLLERTLAPEKRPADRLAFMFLINLKALPAGTERLLLITESGPIDWRETLFVGSQEYTGLARIPFELLALDGLLPPGWDGGNAMLLQSPSRLIFRLPAGNHQLSFRYGINPAVFNDPNAHTDGIGFKVETVTRGKKTEALNRVLEPSSRPADRELQSANLILNSDGDAQIWFVATPGPAENINWDWSVWQDFHLNSRKS